MILKDRQNQQKKVQINIFEKNKKQIIENNNITFCAKK